MQYDDDDDEQVVVKVKIPKYKILFMDIEQGKKEGEVDLNTIEREKNEKVDKNSAANKMKDENRPIMEKVLEYAAQSMEHCVYDKDVATKMKNFLDNDSMLNQPAVTSPVGAAESIFFIFY